LEYLNDASSLLIVSRVWTYIV